MGETKLFVFDVVLKPLIVPASAVEIEIERLKARNQIRGHTEGDEIWEYLDVIDTKASAMLGHISIFAAVAGVLLSFTQEPSLTRTALSVEFITFLFLTFLCLRCLRIMAPSDEETSPEIVIRIAAREMLYRRRIYGFVHEISGLVTLAMIVTAAVKFIG